MQSSVMSDQKNKAASLFEQQRFDSALPILLSIAKEEPHDWETFYMAGQCCRFLGDFSEAVRLMAKVNKWGLR